MAHYKDGTAAQPGDLVKGVSYNRGGTVIVGEVVQITPDLETCNIVVLLAAKHKISGEPVATEIAKLAYAAKITVPMMIVAKGGIAEGHNAADSDIYLVNAEWDSGAAKDFELVHRPD